MFISVGHDEYWSGEQRPTSKPHATRGCNLAFFSGNEMFWKTRWESSIDASDTPNRTLRLVQGDPRQRARSIPPTRQLDGHLA